MEYTKHALLLPLFALLIAFALPCAAHAEPIASTVGGDDQTPGLVPASNEGGTKAAQGKEPTSKEAGNTPDALASDTNGKADSTIEGEGSKAHATTEIEEPEPSSALVAAALEDEKLEAAAETIPDASIHYKVHVQNLGWQDWKADGAEAGTTGESLRLEAVEFYLTGVSGGVHCQVHVQNVGWQQMRSALNGEHEISGTSGQALRLEGIMLTLSGEVSKWYDIEYCTHVQNLGWKEWVRNGDMAGTSGQALRLESLKVRLVPKVKHPIDASDGMPGATCKVHVENDGWHAQKLSTDTIGTTGQGKRVEAVQLWLNGAAYNGGIAYRTHCQNIGWTDWSYNGQISGTTGKSLRVEALEIRLTDDIANYYDVMYRAHVQNIGWQSWTVAGGTAGTTGQSLRMEAFQIKFVKKGAYDVSQDAYLIRSATNINLTAEDPGSSAAVGAQMQLNTNSANMAQTFYVRSEGSACYSIQSVASGLFLADQDSRLLQTADVNDAYHRWTLSWDGGVLLTNVQTGKVIALDGGMASGAKLVTANRSAATSQRWLLEQVPLIADGSYDIQSRVGTVAEIEEASYADGVNVRTATRGGGATQSFHVFQNSGGYVIENCKSYAAFTVADKSKASGANVVQSEWIDDDSQRWVAELSREGYVTFRNKNSGLMLEVDGSSASVGANVQQGAANGSMGQQWKLVPAVRYSLSGNATLDRNVANVLRAHSTLRAAYDWTAAIRYRQNLTFEHSSRVLPDSTTIKLANDFFAEGGNCYQYAACFTWLARGLGYACNTISGWVESNSGVASAHGWAEVTQNGAVYICDPDMKAFYPSRDWYMQTYESAPVEYHFW